MDHISHRQTASGSLFAGGPEPDRNAGAASRQAPQRRGGLQGVESAWPLCLLRMKLTT